MQNEAEEREQQNMLLGYYEVLRLKILNDLKVMPVTMVTDIILEAGFTQLQHKLLYEYCLGKEDYEVCAVLKPLV